MTQKNAAPAASQKKLPRRVSRLGLIGVTALALMVLALGGLVWFQTQRSSPASPEALIAEAAEAYWQSGDVALARELLSGLEADHLARLVARIEADAPDEPTRQRLAALREALQLPLATPSLWDSLFSQKLLLISLALAALPLLGALVVSLLPAIQRPAAPEVVAEMAEVDAPAEAIVVKEQPTPLETQPTPLASQTPPQTDASEPAVDPKMQELLSSVFESETSAIKYEVLLKDLEDLEASNLLAIARRVAQQLKVPSASPRE